MTQVNHGSQDGDTTDSYTKTMRIQAPPRTVYEAVTTVSGLEGWWSNDTFSKNGEITVRFGEIFQTLKLRDLAPDKNVVWEFTEHYLPLEGTTQTDDWVGTSASFDIQPNSDGSSSLVFTHVGLTPQLDCYDECFAGWNLYLESLKQYIEHGTGTPFTGAN